MAENSGISSIETTLKEWRSQGIRFVRFELPDMHGTSRSKMVPIEHAAGYAAEGLNMYGGAGRPRQPVGRRRRHALQRGGRLRRPAARPRSRDGRDPALGRGDRAASSATRLGRRPAAGGAAPPRLPPRARALPRARLRAASSGSSPSSTSSTRETQEPLFSGLPHLQHRPEHLRAVRPGARRASCRHSGST